MKSLNLKLAALAQILSIIVLIWFAPAVYASEDKNKEDLLVGMYGSYTADASKFVITSVSSSVQKLAPFMRQPTSNSHYAGSSVRRASVASTRLPLNIRCLNELTAHNGQNYIDRIIAGLVRRRVGNTPVSEQVRRLTSRQRVAYENCVKPSPKAKRKASEALPGKSVVSLLREHKDFVVPSAGLRIQPDGRHIPSKPAIIYATDAAPRSHDFVLGGRKLKIRFTPVKYMADLGDGGPVLEQTEAPLPYPDAFKGHFYRKFTRSGSFVVEMRTFWRVEWFNPVTGGWVTEGEPLVNVQKTNPQMVKPYQYLLSDDAEEQHGR